MRYRCNICGTSNDCDPHQISRENPDCTGCGSTLRLRAIIGLLSRELFGQTLRINEFPLCKEIRGIGLSDWENYAKRLAKCFTYTNTFYHKEPRLDITHVPDELAGSCDFVISSDVFEHVPPPVSLAFTGARRLLKPGGLLVLTVPYILEQESIVEHFPELYDWSLQRDQTGQWQLHNRTVDGRQQVFTNLIFHGGEGLTLEMRLFTRQGLLQALRDAGFHDVRIAGDPMPEIGVVWSVSWSLPVIARA